MGAMSVAAATSGAVFCAYLEQVLLPELRRSRPDAVLVMDNLPAHKTAQATALLDRSGFAHRCLPAYSSDLNPIEPASAKVKAERRRVAARTAEALHEALGPALARITSQDAAGFFRHHGYVCPNRPAKCSEWRSDGQPERVRSAPWWNGDRPLPFDEPLARNDDDRLAQDIPFRFRFRKLCQLRFCGRAGRGGAGGGQGGGPTDQRDQPLAQPPGRMRASTAPTPPSGS